MHIDHQVIPQDKNAKWGYNPKGVPYQSHNQHGLVSPGPLSSSQPFSIQEPISCSVHTLVRKTIQLMSQKVYSVNMI
jgi:hypothetical protein